MASVAKEAKKRFSSFSDVYSDYYSLIFSSIARKLNDESDTEDICQEIFIRFYEKFDEVENPRKWLFGTMRNVIFEYFRKKRPNEDIDDFLGDVNLTYVNGFRDTRILISEALESEENFENEKEQILFDLIAINHYTYREAGNELGITKKQAGYQYGIIVKRIIDFLHKKGIHNLEDLL